MAIFNSKLLGLPEGSRLQHRLVRGVLHVHLLKDAQLSDAEGQAGQEGQKVGLEGHMGDIWVEKALQKEWEKGSRKKRKT